MTALSRVCNSVLWFIRPERCASRKCPARTPAASVLCDVGAIGPPSAFHKAAAVWDDRLGCAEPQAANWRLAAIGAMALTGLLGVTLAVAASRAEAVVYRINVGPGDQRVIVAGTEKVQPSDAQIAYVLTRFIENIRSLSSDPIVVRSNWHDAYAHLTDRGAEQLNRHTRAADHFAKIGTRTVSVEVISVVRASNRTFEGKQSAWREGISSRFNEVGRCTSRQNSGRRELAKSATCELMHRSKRGAETERQHCCGCQLPASSFHHA